MGTANTLHALVQSVDDIVQNVETLERWYHGSTAERKLYANLIKNGKVFIAKIDPGSIQFAPSKFAGYLKNGSTHDQLRRKRDGRITNRHINRILNAYVHWRDPKYPMIEAAFLDYCTARDIVPSRFKKTRRRYWIIGDVDTLPGTEYRSPDEIGADLLKEGEKLQVFVNKYERSAAARNLCIRHYGLKCVVCDLQFEERYGDIGKGCIHVHHVVPLKDLKLGYTVDPVRDLRPVCPNCHWMLHVNGEAMTIASLRAIVQKLAREK